MSDGGKVGVLYITYTGVMQPLGQSQVLEYLKHLAVDHHVSLLSFERREDLTNQERLAAIEAECIAAGISWTRLRYHRRPTLLATLYDAAIGTVVGLSLANRRDCAIVHARSYVPGLMALAIRRLTKRQFLFDMRGFWADERVDGGIWPAGSRLYLAAKAIERRLLTEADAIVSLSKDGIHAMREFPYLKGVEKRYEFIPTCTNTDTFRPMAKPATELEADGLTFGYVGTASVWHLFRETADCIRVLFDRLPKARLLVVSRTDCEFIRSELESAGVDLRRVEIRSAQFDEMTEQIARMDAAVFFRKPVFSSRAACPTRLGEFLACGKPVLSNSGVGDVAELLAEGRAGVTIDFFNESAYSAAAEALLTLLKDPETSNRCIALADAEFRLQEGVARYRQLYRELAGETEAAKETAVPSPIGEV